MRLDPKRPGDESSASSVHAFDHAHIRRYYDRHTSGFISLGTGGHEGVIHRAVWAPGVTTAAQAFHYVDDRIADVIAGALRPASGHPSRER